MAPKVQILLSSYNGEKYIKEQIISILRQKEVDINLLIRDDGSRDDTVRVVEEIRDDRLLILRGNNIGAANSFFELINASGDYEYYAFSDQDDIWLENKIQAAIERIKPYCEKPAIYSSNARLVDEHLNYISDEDKKPNTSLKSAFMKNYATGCTVVINRSLMNLLKQGKPNVSIYHDWWANLVALSVAGVSCFDNEAYILYRQHENNEIGATNNPLDVFLRRLSRQLKGKHNRDLIARQIMIIYKDRINYPELETLKTISNYKNNKIKILRDRQMTSNNKTVDIFFKLSVLLNLL